MHEVHVDYRSLTVCEESMNNSWHNRDLASDGDGSMVTNDRSGVNPASSCKLFVHDVICKVRPDGRVDDACCGADVEVITSGNCVIRSVWGVDGDGDWLKVVTVS